MMIGVIHRKLSALLLITTLCSGQQASSPAKPAANPTTTVEITLSEEPEIDIQAIVKETEQVEVRRLKMGVFWWVPTEFWEASVRKQGFSAEQARKVFLPFRSYNVFIVAVGDLGLATASWTGEADLKKSLLLRDQHGNTYKPLAETPNDVGAMVEVMRPVFKNLLGSVGEGLKFVLFPAKDPGGNVFADPRKSSEIFLDVSELMGISTRTYTWRLPLSSIMPPKYCPIGKEKVEANWKYCPWHGNKLDEEPHAPVGAPVNPK
jgi:hypothetical protein